MERGDIDKAVIEQAVRNHYPIPDAILNAPELTLGLSFFYSAFLDLSTTRPLTDHAEGPISWLAINEYCKHHGIVGEQRDDMEILIPQIDLEYVRKCRELRKQARDQIRAQQKPPGK